MDTFKHKGIIHIYQSAIDLIAELGPIKPDQERVAVEVTQNLRLLIQEQEDRKQDQSFTPDFATMEKAICANIHAGRTPINTLVDLYRAIEMRDNCGI